MSFLGRSPRGRLFLWHRPFPPSNLVVDSREFSTNPIVSDPLFQSGVDSWCRAFVRSSEPPSDLVSQRDVWLIRNPFGRRMAARMSLVELFKFCVPIVLA